MSNFAHGENSKLTVGSGTGAVTLCIKKFEWEQKYDKHDTTSTCSNGFKEYQLGNKEITFTLEADLDLTEEPWTVLQNGTTVDIVWKGNGTTANVTIPTAVIESAKVTQAVNDIITWTVTGSSSGSYTLA